MQGAPGISVSLSARGARLHCRLPIQSHATKFHSSPLVKHLRSQTVRCQMNKSCGFSALPFSVENNAFKIPGGTESGISGYIARIKEMFADAESRQISVSAYDTAWVAMVPSSQGSPQFPQCLAWLIDNQLPDGSWGIEPLSLLGKDRLCHTLACIIALKTWNVAGRHVEMGLRFIGRNIERILSKGEYTPTGFWSIFPAMLEDARVLGLELSFDSPAIKLAMLQREEILESVALNDMDEYEASLMYSLEGIRKLVDWKKVIKHQNNNGSLFNSPSSTACTLMHTGNVKCLDYLNSLLQNFGNGGGSKSCIPGTNEASFASVVPSVYPMDDLFTLTSMVDRLERLGVARYFKDEIMEALDYAYRLWTRSLLKIREGKSSSLSIPDIANAFMAFRLLRLNGYDVSSDAFCQQKYGNFLNRVNQSGRAVTAMLNVFKASQIMFPGESILEKAKTSSKIFLEKIRASGRIYDESVILNDLPGEVEYALSYPRCASLERLENRIYIEQYGVDDTWIAKTSYKVPCVSNEYFLALAKEDYNICQAKHQEELQQLERWFDLTKFSSLKFARQKLLYCYFSAAATMFEPQMSAARMAWAKNGVLTTVVDDFFDVGGSIPELHSFLEAVNRLIRPFIPSKNPSLITYNESSIQNELLGLPVSCRWDESAARSSTENVRILFSALYRTINEIAQQASAFQGWDVSSHLIQIWQRLAMSMMREAEWAKSGYMPSMEEYMANGKPSIALEPIVLPALYLVGPPLSQRVICHPEYHNIMQLVNTCGRLLNDIQGYKREGKEGKANSVRLYMRENSGCTAEDAIVHIRSTIEERQRELVRQVLKRESVVPYSCRRVHWNMLTVLRLFYLHDDGFTSPTAMRRHIDALLFKPIL